MAVCYLEEQVHPFTYLREEIWSKTNILEKKKQTLLPYLWQLIAFEFAI